MKYNLAYGVHAVDALIEKKLESILEVWIQHGIKNSKFDLLIKRLQKNSIKITFVEKKQLNKMVQGNHQGIVVSYKKFERVGTKDILFFLDQLNEEPFILILDGVTDPHNLGACIRSAVAAGVNLIISPKNNSAPINETVKKIACGATELVTFVFVSNLAQTIDNLKEKGVWIFGADASAKDNIFDLNLTGSIAFVMGSEGKGMRRLTKDKIDYLVKIPINEKINSLNVSVATGICLFEAVRQRSLIKM